MCFLHLLDYTYVFFIRLAHLHLACTSCDVSIARYPNRDNAVAIVILPHHFLHHYFMPGNNEEASIPMEDERNGERMNVRRKFANMLKYFNPFSTMPPPQDEDAPAAKRPRLQASTSISNAEDADTVVDAHTTDTISASPSHTVAVVPACRCRGSNSGGHIFTEISGLPHTIYSSSEMEPRGRR
jgi:hypothetical protein